MRSGDVGAVGLALSLVLVAVAIALSRWRGLGLEGRISWATARATVQLLLVGIALTLVIDPDRPLIWSWLWVVAMIGYAGDVVRRRAPEIPNLLPLAVGAFFLSGLVTLGVIFGLGVFPLESRAIVPLTGMVIGNSLVAAVLISQRFLEDLRD
jgi:putative ABC transport system permease protein